MSTDEILIIGTDPPCPRCDYLNRMVVDIVNDLGLPVNVRHIGYTGAEARKIADGRALTPGTAKDVALKMDIHMDWQAIHDLIDASGAQSIGCCPTAAARWTPELDAALRPCENRALAAGIMMTPVLVINGKPIHQGCVPDPRQTREWIHAAISHTAGTSPAAETTIEVLGPGCDKCDTLYNNALAAVALLGQTERIAVKKRTDIGYFRKMGLVVTPGLIINGRVVSKGRVLTPDQVATHLETLTGGAD